MVCDLDKTLGRSCILRSPLISNTFSWTCMRIQYQLSSYDVQFTFEVLVDDEPIEPYTLPASENEKWISKSYELSISIKLTASRYLVSSTDYEYALVSSVAFLPCPDDTGKLHM